MIKPQGQRQRSNSKPEPVLLLFIIISNLAIVAHWYFDHPEEVGFIKRDGAEIIVRKGVVNGHLDKMILKDDRHVEFRGWAFDGKNSQLVDEILLRYDEEIIYSGQTERERPDLVNEFGDVALKGGFRFDVPAALFKDRKIDNLKIRLFAVSNGAASELKYPNGFK